MESTCSISNHQTSKYGCHPRSGMCKHLTSALISWNTPPTAGQRGTTMMSRRRLGSTIAIRRHLEHCCGMRLPGSSGENQKILICQFPKRVEYWFGRSTISDMYMNKWHPRCSEIELLTCQSSTPNYYVVLLQQESSAHVWDTVKSESHNSKNPHSDRIQGRELRGLISRECEVND